MLTFSSNRKYVYKKHSTNGWMGMVLLNFILAVILGLLLRYMQISPIEGLNFRYITHAHSHVAMLGWVYLALFTFFTRLVLKKNAARYKHYNRLFWLTQISVLGMLVSFIYQGYGAVSITFSAIHIILSYVFVVSILKDLQKYPLANKLQSWFIKTSLFLLVLSTLGVWAMGPIIAVLGKHSVMYNLAIQFYLHFQINGWIVFGVLALFIPAIEDHQKNMRLFYWLLLVSIIVTVLLPVAWYSKINALYYGNSVGVIMQLIAGVIFLKALSIKTFKSFKPITKAWILMMLGYFACKVIFQAVLVFPNLAQAAYANHTLVIAFVHLILLGFASHGLLLHVNSDQRLSKWGSIVFIIAVAITEVLQFAQGGLFWLGKGLISNFFPILFVFSIFIVVGLIRAIVVYWKK